jgi:hypothetical protein
MSHVDDGALHAYLDGALDTLPGAEADRIRMHLETCEACRDRLDEERSLRAEASLVLAGASPAVGEIPPFEELVREAKARGEPRRAGGRIRHLAWAASLVIGLGSGWMLRGMSTPWFSVRALPAAVERRVDDAAVEIQAAEAMEEADVMEVGSREASLQDEAAEAVEAAEAEGALRFQDARDGPAAPLPSRAAEIPMVRTDSIAVAVPEEVRASTVDAREASPDAAGRGIPVTNVADSVVGQVARSFAARQERAREDRAVAAVLAEEAVAAPEPDVERTKAQLDRLSATLVVPGLDVLEVAWLGGEGSVGVVRVLQVSERGDTLELLHLPPGMDPSVLEPPAGGLSELMVPRDGGWLVVRGPVERTVLEALVARITGG